MQKLKSYSSFFFKGGQISGAELGGFSPTVSIVKNHPAQTSLVALQFVTLQNEYLSCCFRSENA